LESRDVRELKARRAKERDLESTVRKLAGIEEAFVSIEQIDKGGFPQRTEQRALVSVRALGQNRVDEGLLRSIRQAVAAGGGVEKDNVTVLDLNTGATLGGTDADGKPTGEENIYAAALARYESMYREKIESLLRHIPGVKVEVFAELDKSLTTRTATQKFDTQPVALRSTEYTKDSTTTTPQNQGRPGVASNVVSNRPQTVNTVSGPESSSNEQRTETNSVAGTTQEVVEQAGLVPEYVKAAVSVPRSYFRKVWEEENPTAPGTDPVEPDRTALKAIETRVIQEIEEQVVALLPEPAPGVDKFPRISVKPFTETPLPSPPGPGLGETTWSWFSGNWQTLGLFLLALVGVFFLRGALKSTAVVPVAVTTEPRLPVERFVEAEEEEQEEEMDDDYANSLKARFQRSGRSLRDELGELVKEDPDAAASVLQNWIGDAV
jgi:flagellar M-ring protein FliF